MVTRCYSMYILHFIITDTIAESERRVHQLNRKLKRMKRDSNWFNFICINILHRIDTIQSILLGKDDVMRPIGNWIRIQVISIQLIYLEFEDVCWKINVLSMSRTQFQICFLTKLFWKQLKKFERIKICLVRIWKSSTIWAFLIFLLWS